MEDLTVALLGGVTPRVQDRGLTAALLGLLTVEARHAAWARHIAGADPAPRPEDEPMALADGAGDAVDADPLRGRAAADVGRRAAPPFTG